LPSTGTLVHLAPPEENLHVRVDTGVEQGDAISPFYDPMIAKLIVWDANREQALARMLQALAQYRIVGVANNVEFLSRLVASPAFSRAELDTGLIERERDFLFATDAPIPREVFLVAALATLLREEARAGAEAAGHTDPLSPWHRRDGWRLNSHAERRLLFRAGELEKAVRVRYAEGGYALEFDVTPWSSTVKNPGSGASWGRTPACGWIWAACARTPPWWSPASGAMYSYRGGAGLWPGSILYITAAKAADPRADCSRRCPAT